MIPGIIATRRRAGELWTPAQLTPFWWLKETGHVDAGAGALSQWSDSSGNGRNFVQGTAANRPTIITAGLNGMNTIRADGTNDFLSNTAVQIAQNVGQLYIATVHKKTATDAGVNKILFHASRGTDGGARFAVGLSDSTNANFQRITMRRQDADAAGQCYAASSLGTAWVISVAYADWNNGDAFLYQQGALSNSNTAITSSGLTANTASSENPSLFCQSPSAPVNFADAELAEIFAVRAAVLTTSDREKIEGYLAHRWGLASVLPGGHPYKTNPPML